MTKIKIRDLTINVTGRWGKVKVKFDNRIALFSNQNVNNISELIKYNFNIVSNHYETLVEKSNLEFEVDDIICISISIVLDYLYMYNLWRNIYKNQKNRDLSFNEEDFSASNTYDIIFSYLKNKYPNDWKEKSAVLLDVGLDELEVIYKNREYYYNK